jgi:hypothetical protein
MKQASLRKQKENMEFLLQGIKEFENYLKKQFFYQPIDQTRAVKVMDTIHANIDNQEYFGRSIKGKILF